MASRKKIIWTERAEFELIEVLEFYISRNKSNTYSERLLSEIDKRCEHIQQFEFVGISTSDKFVRNLIFDNYSIFYQVLNNRIEILSFWDNRQNPNNRIDNQ